MILAGGLSFVVGALAFVAVFSYLAATFDYPAILEGSAAEVLPRLRGGGSLMRATWALYAFLPLLLIPRRRGDLPRLPVKPGPHDARAGCGVSWRARHVPGTDALAQHSLGLGRCICGIECGCPKQPCRRVPRPKSLPGQLHRGVLGRTVPRSLLPPIGSVARRRDAVSEVARLERHGVRRVVPGGALRNATPMVQPIADVNNILLPLWMVVLGASLVWRSKRE